MNEPWQYVTSDTTLTVHLHQSGGVRETLCGRVIKRRWQFGDETQSGIAATCGTCRRAAGVAIDV